MFDIGMPELIVIFIVALLVFGPKKLPELGRNIGKGLSELKKAVTSVKEEMDAELSESRRPPANSEGKPGKEADTADKNIKEAEKTIGQDREQKG